MENKNKKHFPYPATLISHRLYFLPQPRLDSEEMSTQSRRSSSTTKIPPIPDNSMATGKRQLAKKRPALTDITNQSKKLVQCTSKVAKKKETSTSSEDEEGHEQNSLLTPRSMVISPLKSPNKSIGSKENNNLYIPQQTKKEGKICKRNLLLEMESNDNAVGVGNVYKEPQFCAHISHDIYKNLRSSEAKKRPSAHLEMVQKDISVSMRAILINWLVQVVEEYTLVPETLYLTVNYIDRYLSGNSINRQQLQLLGVACMMIAVKYEEISAPKVEEFCYLIGNSHCKKEILQMESAVLNYLKFEMTVPTAKLFLRQFVHAAQMINQVESLQFECLANYIAELSLLEYIMLHYAPSLIAASAVFLAKFILSPSRKPWDSVLGHYTLYQPSDLYECVKVLHRLCLTGGRPNLSAVKEKYSQHKYKFVAEKDCPSSIPEEFFEN